MAERKDAVMARGLARLAAFACIGVGVGYYWHPGIGLLVFGICLLVATLN